MGRDKPHLTGSFMFLLKRLIWFWKSERESSSSEHILSFALQRSQSNPIFCILLTFNNYLHVLLDSISEPLLCFCFTFNLSFLLPTLSLSLLPTWPNRLNLLSLIYLQSIKHDVFIPNPNHPRHSQRGPQHNTSASVSIPTTWRLSPQSSAPFLSFLLTLFCQTTHLKPSSPCSNLLPHTSSLHFHTLFWTVDHKNLKFFTFFTCTGGPRLWLHS